MKEIPLTKSKITLIDDIDFNSVNQFKWHARKHRKTYYACRTIRLAGGAKASQRLHQFLLPGVVEIDHKDEDGLNNQRCNLRPATASQNKANRGKPLGDFSSRFKGVSWHRQIKKYRAGIMVDGKHISLGCYDSEEDAAISYDYAAKIYFGEFARLNFP